jgi:hypothetical protein
MLCVPASSGRHHRDLALTDRVGGGGDGDRRRQGTSARASSECPCRIGLILPQRPHHPQGGSAIAPESRLLLSASKKLLTASAGSRKVSAHQCEGRTSPDTPGRNPCVRPGQFSRRSIRCFGSGFSSPFSTRLTISVSAALAGVGSPISSPFRTMKPFRKSISVRRPFTMS